jgi:hypothetical protein
MLSRARPVPGGVARIRVGASDAAPRVRLGADLALVVRQDREWVAFVGIALATAPGSIVRVEVDRADGTVERHDVKVAPKSYASQHLKVAPGKVELAPEDLAR